MAHEQAVAATVEQDVPETPTGLAEETRQRIRDAYQAVSTRPGFRSRASQRRMIAEVAKTLTGEYGSDRRILAVEGPTGTGKSLGYLLPAIPVGQALGKSVILSTATVALQEQLVEKDLPDLQAQSGLEFSYVLAKGCRRYVCDRNLDRLAKNNHDQGHLDLGDDGGQPGEWQIKPEPDDIETVQAMAGKRDSENWSGDLDEWPDTLRGPLIGEITTDKAGCTGRRCPFHHRCAFLKASTDRKDKDVVVANHALVMSDLMLGGGVVLPAPDDSIYIIDEAHHLPDIAIDQGAAEARVVASQSWIKQLPRDLARAIHNVSNGVPAAAGGEGLVERLSNTQIQLNSDLPRLTQHLNDLVRVLKDKHPYLNDPNRPSKGQRDRRPPWKRPSENWRFPMGCTPDDPVPLFRDAGAVARAINGHTTKMAATLRKAAEKAPDNRAIGSSLAAALWLTARFDTLATALTRMTGGQPNPDQWPTARWIECLDDGADFLCCASPTNAASLLHNLLWDQCSGAIATSATLTALGRFDRFFEQSGLGFANAYSLQLPSPFDYQGRATLSIPRDMPPPNNAESHTNAIIERINSGELINPDEGTLMLFASWRQMKQIAEALDAPLADQLLMQGDAPRHTLLENHKARIAAGQGSLLFGVASFSEGIDLPGDQCTHVIIAKIPFAVPDAPVDATRAEWLESKGRNPFMEMSVPEASFKLIQATGRLLRSEIDRGRVTILDRRLNDKPYGRMMVNALPPFKQGG